MSITNDVTASAESRINLLADKLTKSTAQIKSDRALEIAELAELEAKRRVEDYDRELKQLIRRRKSSLDLSPDNTYSIIKVKDFEPADFIDGYNNLGLQIREASIKLNNAKQSYNELFGFTYEIEKID